MSSVSPIVSNTVLLQAAVNKALDSGKFVEMSPAAGNAIANRVDTSQGVDCSPSDQPTGPDAGFCQRDAFVVDGELYAHTAQHGGMAQFITSQWEDLGQAPFFTTDNG